MLFKQIAPLPATSGNIVTSLTFTGDLFKPKFNSFHTSCSVTTAFTKNETCYRKLDSTKPSYFAAIKLCNFVHKITLCAFCLNNLKHHNLYVYTR